MRKQNNYVEVGDEAGRGALQEVGGGMDNPDKVLTEQLLSPSIMKDIVLANLLKPRRRVRLSAQV